jgi:hypothetical protein
MDTQKNFMVQSMAVDLYEALARLYPDAEHVLDDCYEIPATSIADGGEMYPEELVMSELAAVNFLATNSPGPDVKLLAHCWACGFGYEQTADHLRDIGHYVPEDQWDVYSKLLDMQVNLDIGNRQQERETA